MRIRLLFFIALLFTTFYSFSNVADSLIHLINNTDNHRVKVKHYIDLFNYYNDKEPDSAFKYISIALKISKEKEYKEGIANSYNNLGTYYAESEPEKSLDYYLKSYQIEKKENDIKGMGISLNNIGITHRDVGNYDLAAEYFKRAQKLLIKDSSSYLIAKGMNINLGIIYDIKGDYEKALDYYLKAKKTYEKENYKPGLASAYLNIGLLYDNNRKFEKALEYYTKSAELYKKLNNYSSLGNSYNNIGCIYEEFGELDKAMEYYKKCVKINKKFDNRFGIALNYSNIGGVFQNKDQSDSAFYYYNMSIKIKQSLGDKVGLVDSYNKLGLYYAKNNAFSKAEECLNNALEISKKIDRPQFFKETYRSLSHFYKKKKDYKKALYYHEKFKIISDNIVNEEVLSQLTRKEMQYKFKKKEELAKIEQEKKELKHKAELKRQRMQKIYSFIGLGLTIILVFMAFRAYRIKRKSNQILKERNEEITHQKEEIETQRDEIETQRDRVTEQKNIIEEIHSELNKSIDYAKRIQNSILPGEKLIKQYFLDSFIFLKPKDIVSGDFYWVAQVEGHTIVAAADCTGHGVPGGFMSMLGISFLREIVQKEYITLPDIILNKLRKEIIRTLKQKGEYGEQKDGMDMALISINNTDNILQFAGANNPLYIVSKEKRDIKYENLDSPEGKKLYEIKGDKMPIAIYEKMDTYKMHEVKLTKGDQLYMFSDGFADQFGGPQGKKFKYKPFKKLLIANADKNFNEQKEIFEKTFNEWKKGYDQIDDVLVIGMKI